MVLKYIVPFDRFVVDTPLRIDEVHARLKAVTVKRHWFRIFKAVPGTFEGTLRRDGFVLLTSAEGYQLFGFSRMRNAYRPICSGTIEPSPGGSRITVRARLPLFFMIFLAIWLTLFLTSAGGIWLQSGEDARYLAPILIVTSIILVMWLSVIRTFRTMRDRFKTVLEKVLA